MEGVVYTFSDYSAVPPTIRCFLMKKLSQLSIKKYFPPRV